MIQELYNNYNYNNYMIKPAIKELSLQIRIVLYIIYIYYIYNIYYIYYIYNIYTHNVHVYIIYVHVIYIVYSMLIGPLYKI